VQLLYKIVFSRQPAELPKMGVML